MNDLFRNPKAADFPNKVRQFVEEEVGNLPKEALSDLLARLGRILATDRQMRSEGASAIKQSMLALFKRVTRENYSGSPSELSTCVRALATYAGEIKPTDSNDSGENVRVANRILGKWGECLEQQSPGIADLCDVITGMSFSRLNLANGRGFGWDVSLVRELLSESSKELVAILNESKTSLDSEDLEKISALSRFMAARSVTSKILMQEIVSIFWPEDIQASRSCELPASTLLGQKISVLYAATCAGITEKNKVRELVGAVLLSLDRQPENRISPESLGAILVTAKEHGIELTDTDAQKIEEYLENDLPENWHRMKNYQNGVQQIIFCLAIARGGEISESVVRLGEQIVDRDSNLSFLENKTSVALTHLIQNSVVSEFTSKKSLGPCSLDFLVNVNVNGKNVAVNLEVDGFPYDSTFQIDDKSFNNTAPFIKGIRDMFVNFKYPVVRMSERELFSDHRVNLNPLSERLQDAARSKR